MRVRHPYALDDDGPTPDGAVHWGGRREWSDVDDDGTFFVPDDRVDGLSEWAEGYGYDISQLLVDGDAEPEPEPEAETCDAIKTDGERCGRELPCPYHSEG